MKEFVCAECGRRILRIVSNHDDLAICAHCVAVPAWFNEPKLCRIFDPENSRNPPPHERIADAEKI